MLGGVIFAAGKDNVDSPIVLMAPIMGSNQ